MVSPADLVAILLVLAAFVATVNRQFIHLPRAIALLFGSLAISAGIILIDPLVPFDLRGLARETLSAAALPDVLLDIVLGLMLFAASLHVDLTELERQKWTVLALATGSVIIATITFGAAIWALFAVAGSPVPLGWCLVLGAVLAPTDAVVIDALLRNAPLPESLKTAISGESLFNDGAGIVMFQIMLRFAQGEHGVFFHGQIAAALAFAGIGGGAVGCLTGFLAARAMRLVDEPVLLLMISLAAVTATYRLVDLFGMSGITAVVACGLVLRMQAPRDADGESRITEVTTFWHLTDELLNALFFVLIGFELFSITFTRSYLVPVIAALPLALLSRFIGVALSVLVLRGGGRAQRRGIAMLTWAGLRGGVSIALALTLPPSPYRGQLLAVCYAVVIASVFVQGLGMAPMIRWLYGREEHGAEPADRVSS
jgi:CPA1 family monovalent cation:H+ antiporter